MEKLISKWGKKSHGQMLKQVVVVEVIGKNKKGKPIHSSRTKHIPI